MLICLSTLIINISGLAYNNQDFKILARSQEVCKSDYDGCIKSFQKREQGVYRVICGAKEYFSKKELDKAELSVILEEIRHHPKDVQKKKLKEIGVEL